MDLINIVSVEKIASFELANHLLIHDGKVLIANNPPFINIPIVGLSHLSIESSLNRGVRIYTSTLTFTTKYAEEWSHGQYCFLLTSADGSRLLLGTHVRPYPVVADATTYADSLSTPSSTLTTVTYSAVNPPLRVL